MSILSKIDSYSSDRNLVKSPGLRAVHELEVGGQSNVLVQGKTKERHLIETSLNDLAPYIALASFAIAALALVFSIRGDRRKSGIDIRADFSVASSVWSAERWVSEVRLENLKDRPVSVYKIYLEVGHGLHIEVEDFTDIPLSLDAYSVHQQEYDPVEFYSLGLSRVTGFLGDKKSRLQIVLTTSQGRYCPRRGTKTFDDPLFDTLRNNITTGVVHPRRFTHKGRSYGSEAKFVVTFSNADGKEELIPIYPRDYEIRKFRNFKLTREAIESQQSLEEFLQEQVAAGNLPYLSFGVVDLDAVRRDVFKDYSESKTLTPQGWFSNKVVGRGLTLWKNFTLARKNRRIRSRSD